MYVTMKKTLLIILALLISLSIVSVFVYLMVFGKPKDSSEVFAKFGLGNNSTISSNPSNTASTPQNTNTTVNVAPAKLQQLTTRPVAGAYVSDEHVRYVEQGTGHVYEINLTTGKETLISGTTIPQTVNALFSHDGTYTAITAFTPTGTKTIVGDIIVDDKNGGKINGVSLPENAREVQFTTQGNGVYYLMKDNTGSVGYIYNIEKKTSGILFNIPLRDVHVLWGNPLYVYTTPTNNQTGYIYKIDSKSTLRYVASGMRGLLVFRYSDGLALTSVLKDKSTIYTIDTEGTVSTQALPYIPEKCVSEPTKNTLVFCGVPKNSIAATFPDNWYMGVVSSVDTLWSMDPYTGEAKPILDLLAESGQEIDVSRIGISESGSLIYLINKNDNALWLYDRRVP